MSDSMNSKTEVSSNESDSEADDRVTREQLLKAIADNDIRVIFYGDAHKDNYTKIPDDFLDHIKDQLTLIFLENALSDGQPDMDLYGFSASEKKKNDAKETDCEPPVTSKKKEVGETERLQEHIRGFQGKPLKLKNEAKIIQYIVKHKLIDKTRAFGCQDHKYTRDSLMASILTLDKGDLILISIGLGHFFRPSDAADYENPQLSRSRSGMLENNVSDEDPVAENDLGAATIYSDNRSGGKLLTSSMALIDHFSGVDQFGFLIIIGGWYATELVLFPTSAEDRTIDLNLAVGKLMQRQRNNPHMVIAGNYFDWTASGITNIFNGKNKEYFDLYQTYMRNFLAVQTYSQLIRRSHNWRREFHEQSGVDAPWSLFFAPVSYLVPGAKSSETLKNQILSYQSSQQNDVSDSEERNYQDSGSDFDI